MQIAKLKINEFLYSKYLSQKLLHLQTQQVIKHLKVIKKQDQKSRRNN